MSVETHFDISNVVVQRGAPLSPIPHRRPPFAIQPLVAITQRLKKIADRAVCVWRLGIGHVAWCGVGVWFYWMIGWVGIGIFGECVGVEVCR